MAHTAAARHKAGDGVGAVQGGIWRESVVISESMPTTSTPRAAVLAERCGAGPAVRLRRAVRFGWAQQLLDVAQRVLVLADHLKQRLGTP